MCIAPSVPCITASAKSFHSIEVCWCTVHPSDPTAVFGHVIDGLDVLDRMEKVPCDASDRPKTDIVLHKVTIHANPLA